MGKTDYRRAAAVLGILAVVLLIAGLVFKGGGRPEQVKSEIRSWITAAGKPVAQAADGIRSGLDGLLQFKKNRQEKERLVMELQNLQQENADLQLTRSEYEELKQLERIFSYERIRYDQVQAANVILSEPARWMHSFTIDRGGKSGIETGDAVLAGDALIGRVAEVSDSSAKVVSLLDETHKISFQAESEEAAAEPVLGVVRGDGTGGLSGYLLGNQGSVKAGDRIRTSGIGAYPKGFLIGEVREIKKERGSRRMQFAAQPAVDPKTVRKVAVIL